jgi:hypothetical protein
MHQPSAPVGPGNAVVRGFALAYVVMILTATARAADLAVVTVIATPGGGIQPQAAIDAAGVIHLVAFQGTPAGGDVVYTRIDPGQAASPSPSTPIRVNERPGSAIAMGTIRGAQMALGREGRVHVAWNGAAKALPANPIQGAPMLYARSNSGPMVTSFEPERNLMRRTFGLDGGGTVAANATGEVFVAWHGRSDDDPANEAGRRAWVARSGDDGATFAIEEPASTHPTGACACCGMKAWAGGPGQLALLFRAATAGTERDMVLLDSRDHGSTFRATRIHPWRVSTCPMSSAAMVSGPTGLVVAWETMGQVFCSRIDPEAGPSPSPISPPGDPRNRKHPALAVNGRGETLLAWSEGTAWQRGGALAWCVFDPSGRPTPASGRIDRGISVWSLPTAVARPEGGFVIIH